MPYFSYSISYGLWTLIFWALSAAMLPLLALVGLIGLLPYLFILFRFAPFFAMLVLANRYAREFSDPPSNGDAMTLALSGAAVVAALSVVAFALFNFGGWVAARILGSEIDAGNAVQFSFDRSLMQMSAIIAFLSLAIIFILRTKSLIAHKKANSL